MKKLLPIITIISLLGLLIPISAHAQVSLPLTVAPSRQELEVNPGEETAFNVKFYNRSDTPVSGLLKVADFIVEDKEGTPTFLEETPTVIGPAQVSRRFAAASWVTLPYDRMTIAPHDSVLIQAKITAPPDARPGGRYLAVSFETSATPGQAVGLPREAETPVSARIAGLVYLRVSGPITEKAQVIQFTAPRFSEYGPVKITTEISNQGDYHIRPKGTITLTNMLGRQAAKEKLQESNIFPDVSRVYENELGEKWMWGKYKAQLVASYGETGKALTATIFFWVFPWRVATAVVLAVIIVVLLLNTFIGRLKRRQQELEEKIRKLEEKLAGKES